MVSSEELVSIFLGLDDLLIFRPLMIGESSKSEEVESEDSFDLCSFIY